ncbi:hypothetical protein NSQ93_22145 [Bacillus sp. FSL W8-0445]|uniref:hypothetical protein n=1 Tax=Bacillus TaxID=1386 RepID=UPI00237C7A66|nr:hypothetical protein [Bacillus licheniformis]MDE1407084.1 hypothetical protein [Bacillus licheniformis]
MNKEKLKEFLKELNQLEKKYDIYISADYREEIDYDWDEEPYVGGIDAYLVFSDEEGNSMTENDLNIY